MGIVRIKKMLLVSVIPSPVVVPVDNVVTAGVVAVGVVGVVPE